MNPQVQNSLQLRDIHLPDAVSWWPPAIGWWILVSILLLGFYLLPKLYRRLTYVSLSTISNKALVQIKNHHSKNNNAIETIQRLSKLLRQINMSFNGRENIANLTGEQWIHSLNTLTEKEFFKERHKESLINAPYQKNIDIDINELIDVTEQWIKALPNIKVYKKRSAQTDVLGVST